MTTDIAHGCNSALDIFCVQMLEFVVGLWVVGFRHDFNDIKDANLAGVLVIYIYTHTHTQKVYLQILAW